MGLMTGNSNSVIYIDYTSEFKRNLRALAKKYRHIRSDIQPLINQLQTGTLIGNQVKGSTYTLFKSRARNSDIKKGKSSGYRVIYWQKTSHHLILVTIYSKLDQSDISPQHIQRIIKHFSQAGQDAGSV
jgi:mRNA-degrading endonuclease RelE of RelBE toxin-antitoxin system